MAKVAEKATQDLYERDHYAWLEEQALLLRAHRFDDLDLDNLIEEVEAIRRAEVRGVEHHARVVIAQLLQLAHSTLSDPRPSWKMTANSHRHQLEMRLRPSLRAELEPRLEEVYGEGREIATTVLETEGTNGAWVPQPCPWPLAQILEDDWFPTNVYGFDRLE